MSRSKAIELYQVLSETLSAESMLDFLINNYLSGAQALEALEATRKEFYDDDDDDGIDYSDDEYLLRKSGEGRDIYDDEEEEVDGSSWRESEDYFDEDDRELKELEEIKRIEIADLIGRDFFHKDADHLIYTIAECVEDAKVRIVWHETQDVYYSVSEVMMYIQDGTWILV